MHLLIERILQKFGPTYAEIIDRILQKFSTTATQAILYFDSFAPGETVSLHFRLRAKYPIRVRTFSSRVYEYYDPQISSLAKPIALEVRKR